MPDTTDPEGGARLYAGQTRQERLGRRHDAFVEAGLELFGTVGFRATSMRAVCRATGLSDRYFYEQFPTMEDLLLAVLTTCAGRLEQSVLAALEDVGDDLHEASRMGLDAFLACAENDPRLARVAWFEAIGVSDRVDREYRRLNDRFATLMLLIAIEHRGGDPDDPGNQLIASVVTGGIKETVVRWIMDDFSPPRQELVGHLADVLVAVSSLMNSPD